MTFSATKSQQCVPARRNFCRCEGLCRYDQDRSPPAWTRCFSMGGIPPSSSRTPRLACAPNQGNFSLRRGSAHCRCDQYFFCVLLRTTPELNRSSRERPIFACSHLFRALFGVCRLRDHLWRWPNSCLVSIAITSIQACPLNRPA